MSVDSLLDAADRFARELHNFADEIESKVAAAISGVGEDAGAVIPASGAAAPDPAVPSAAEDAVAPSLDPDTAPAAELAPEDQPAPTMDPDVPGHLTAAPADNTAPVVPGPPTLSVVDYSELPAPPAVVPDAAPVVVEDGANVAPVVPRPE